MTTTTPSGIDDLYRVLGVGPQASPVEIKQAYRRLARQLHPDVNRDPAPRAGFVAVTSAYEVLSNPGRRAAYDHARTAATAPPSPPPPSGSGAAGRSESGRAAGPPAADYIPADDPGGGGSPGQRRWSDYEPRPEPPPAPDPWWPYPPRPAPPRWMAGSRQRWPLGWPGGRIEQHRWLCPFTLALWRIAPLPCNGFGKLLGILGWVYGGSWAGQALLAQVPATALDSATVSVLVLLWLPLVVWTLRGLISGYFAVTGGIGRMRQRARLRLAARRRAAGGGR